MQKARPKWFIILLFSTILPAFVIFLSKNYKQNQQERERKEKIEQLEAEMEADFQVGRLRDSPDGKPNAFGRLMEGKK